MLRSNPNTFSLDAGALADEIGSRMERRPKFAESIEIPISLATEEVLAATAELVRERL